MCSPFQNVIWHAIRSFPPGEFLQKEQHFRCGLSVEKEGPLIEKCAFQAKKSSMHTVRATKQKSPENKDLLNMKFTLKFNLHINYAL